MDRGKLKCEYGANGMKAELTTLNPITSKPEVMTTEGTLDKFIVKGDSGKQIATSADRKSSDIGKFATAQGGLFSLQACDRRGGGLNL